MDVSKSFARYVGEMSRKSEWMFVNSIVNTVTLYDHMGKVQFLVEGEVKDFFGESDETRVAIFRPLMRNVGAILD